jgi:hypothetical protein
MRNSKSTTSAPSRSSSASVDSTRQRRGRPPKKAFINVLVRTSTRASLTQLKAVTGLPSQGEVIDYLVTELARHRHEPSPG